MTPEDRVTLDAAEKAAALAERYGEAIVAISEALDAPISDGARVLRVRVIIAGLDSEASHDR
jgi:hypothetical protein